MSINSISACPPPINSKYIENNAILGNSNESSSSSLPIISFVFSRACGS